MDNHTNCKTLWVFVHAGEHKIACLGVVATLADGFTDYLVMVTAKHIF